jgi:uncharacterized protein (DUF885 family)
MRHLLAAGLLAAALVHAPARAQAQAQGPAGAPAASAEARALRDLFAASDEDFLRRKPLFALFRGDQRYADQFGDFITDEYFTSERAAAERDLAALRAIDRSALSPREQVSYDVFEWTLKDRLANFAPDILPAWVVRPVDHFNAFHTFFPELSSGQGIAPFRTLADYENNLKRIDGYVTFTDRAIERMRQGMASGVVQPRLVIDNVIGQLDTQLAQGVEQSVFMAPLAKFPESIAASDQARLRTAYAQAVREKILPAHRRLRDFLANEYRPVARESVGLREMKGGPAYYRVLVASQTTTDMGPEDIHQLGLREVARIRGEMEGVKRKVGFAGTLPQFFEHIRTDPKFKVATKEELTERYYEVGRRVEATLPRLFSLVPRSKLEIRPTPEFREKNSAGGEYQPGTPDGSRPGVFYFNTYDLPSRTTPGIETLYLHEGAPGHHFQIMLGIENGDLPAFQRFGGNTAYVEGWALYAESLGEELGLFTDPYQKQGNLDDEMLRAMRLVVDTGLHHKGWSRDRAIQYMLDNSAMGRTDATAEVERYIAIPGQALAYKVGQLKIRELRTRAELALGPRFDIREFHARVLEDGALPLQVLEAKIDRWIAQERRRPAA